MTASLRNTVCFSLLTLFSILLFIIPYDYIFFLLILILLYHGIGLLLFCLYSFFPESSFIKEKSKKALIYIGENIFRIKKYKISFDRARPSAIESLAILFLLIINESVYNSIATGLFTGFFVSSSIFYVSYLDKKKIFFDYLKNSSFVINSNYLYFKDMRRMLGEIVIGRNDENIVNNFMYVESNSRNAYNEINKNTYRMNIFIFDYSNIYKAVSSSLGENFLEKYKILNLFISNKQKYRCSMLNKIFIINNDILKIIRDINKSYLNMDIHALNHEDKKNKLVSQLSELKTKMMIYDDRLQYLLKKQKILIKSFNALY